MRCHLCGRESAAIIQTDRGLGGLDRAPLCQDCHNQAAMRERPTPTLRHKAIAAEALAELASATERFPPFHSAHEGFAVLKEEVDELWDEIKRNDPGRARAEALQVAAMALRLIHDIAPERSGPDQ